MTCFYVNSRKIESVNLELKEISQKLVLAKSAFNRIQRRIKADMPQLSDNLNYIKSDLDHEVDIGCKYEDYLGKIVIIYKENENKILPDKTSVETSSVDDNVTSLSDATADDYADNQLLDWLKSILQWMDKAEYDDRADVAGKGLSYVESLYKFLTGDMKGLSGAEDWFDLSDKSIGLWTGFYKYLKVFYNEAGNIFSIGNQTKVEGLGLGGNILGLISSIFGIADTIDNTENPDAAGVIGQLFGVGDDAVDIWESCKELQNVGDASSSGIYTPLKLYTSIAKSYLEAIGQGFSSYDKYSADGSWDLGDTAATGIESSVSGLYAMASALTFGLVSEGTTGVSADDISSFLENSCGDIGTRAGNYIMNDSSLYQKYQDSNTIGRVFITFYAALRA